MTIQRTDTFVRQYLRLHPDIRKKVDRQLSRLLTHQRHPSLVAKKMAGHQDVWEVRVDILHRLTFQVIGQTVLIRKVGTHDVLRAP